MQRIVIKNFGPIKEVDIPVHDFMIFIGPQASGKSTIAKAIYFFRDLRSVFYDFFFSLDRPNLKEIFIDNIVNAFTRQISYEFNRAWKDFPLDAFDITFYYSRSVYIQVIGSRDKSSPQVGLSNELITSIHGYLEQIPTSENGLHKEFDKELKQTITNTLLQQLITANIGWYSENHFIPSGRNIFSLLANKRIFEGDRIDTTIQDFDNDINNLRYSLILDLVKNSPEKDLQIAYGLSQKILKGSYKFQQSQDFIQVQNNDTNVPLDKSSSGQQEAIWPVLILLNSVNNGESNFLIFEEPEAHLYPESQKHISDLIALSINRPNNQAIITTHSPYILGAINNLIYANEVGKINPEKVETIVDKNLWLDYDRVMAYFVDNGGVRSIMDAELRTIKNEEIDSASRIINEEYDKLSDIEFSK